MPRDMKEEHEVLVNCAKCPRPVCNTPGYQEGPDDCPFKVRPEVIKKATDRCLSPEFHKAAYMASKQEGSGYMRLPHAPNTPSPVKSRLEEVMEFAQRMGYKRLGVACSSSAKVGQIGLENNGHLEANALLPDGPIIVLSAF